MMNGVDPNEKLSLHEFQTLLYNVLFRTWEEHGEEVREECDEDTVTYRVLPRAEWLQKLRDALEPEAFSQHVEKRLHIMREARAALVRAFGEEPPEPEGYERCVHTEHCCVDHGCKYGDEGCPVETGQKPQSYFCENCELPTA